MAESCPCCGYATLPDRYAYDLCPVCWWEDDGAEHDDAARQDGPNGRSLAEGQRLYQRYGTSTLYGLHHVRAPAPDEPRDPQWAPLPRPDEGDRLPEFLRDLGALLTVATDMAHGEARASRSEADIGRFDGLRAAYVLLVEQADSFGIARQEVGVDPDFDKDRDFLLDPPRGRFAG